MISHTARFGDAHRVTLICGLIPPSLNGLDISTVRLIYHYRLGNLFFALVTSCASFLTLASERAGSLEPRSEVPTFGFVALSIVLLSPS
jgi:hypothetical protein